MMKPGKDTLQTTEAPGTSISRRRLLQSVIALPLAASEGTRSFAADASGGPGRQPLPTYDLRQVAPFEVDGDVNKPVWRSLKPVHLIPATGKRQRLQSTVVRACWSETHIYAAFHCVDADAHSTFTRRDEPLYDQDVAEVFLCPTGDLRHYLELEFSPHGVIWDGRIENPGGKGEHIVADRAWNCEGLLCAAHIERDSAAQHDLWWSVEIAAPFAGLGVAVPSPGDRWRGNIYRIDYTKPVEYSAWSPTLTDPANFHVPGRFGWLRFTAGKR